MRMQAAERSTMIHKTADTIPRNGKFLVALLVGGPADVYLEMREKLRRRRGIWIGHHWEYKYDHAGKVIPKNVDLVLILRDMISHPLHDKAVDACKRAQIPYIRTQRKWTQIQNTLAYHGFRCTHDEIDPATATPPNVIDTTCTVEPAPATQLSLAPPAPEPAPAPVLHLLPPMTPLAEPQPSQPEPNITDMILRLQDAMQARGFKSLILTLKEITIERV